MGILEIHNIKKTFENKAILNGLNLDIQSGEFWGLIGKNGAGKSTLINILSGVVLKTSGSFKIRDAEDTALDKVKYSLGIMPDVSELYGDMSGMEFLTYMLKLKGVRIGKRDIQALFEKVDLNVSLKSKIKTYSFGMKKKIAIAQAIAGDPQILILDEPTSGVDPESILHLQNLFETLNKGGTTIFLTSHNLNEIERLCTHISILNKGVFQVSGSMQKIINNYTTAIRVLIHSNIPSDFSITTTFSNQKLLEANREYLTFEVQREEQIAEIINLLVAHGVPIYSVEQKRATLEEIFLG